MGRQQRGKKVVLRGGGGCGVGGGGGPWFCVLSCVCV